MSERKESKKLDEIRRVLRAHMPELRQQYGVLSLGLFGSHVRGDERRGSDLDLLVQFDDRPLTLFDIVRLENHLSEMVGLKVDLVEKSALKPAIGRRILAEVLPV